MVTSLYDIFADPDERVLIRAYCLENLLITRLDYDGLRAHHLATIPPQPITWNYLPSYQDDEMIVYGGYVDFLADSIAQDMLVWGIGLAYENLQTGEFYSLGFQHFEPKINFVSLEQRLRARIAYTVISKVEA